MAEPSTSTRAEDPVQGGEDLEACFTAGFQLAGALPQSAGSLSEEAAGSDVGSEHGDESLTESAGCGAEPPRQSWRPLTLERLREVERRPPLTEDQLVEVVGNLRCCLTEVLALTIMSE